MAQSLSIADKKHIVSVIITKKLQIVTFYLLQNTLDLCSARSRKNFEYLNWIVDRLLALGRNETLLIKAAIAHAPMFNMLLILNIINIGHVI